MAKHKPIRITRVDERSVGVAIDDPDAAFTFQRLAHARNPVMVTRSSTTGFLIREMTDDEMRSQRGKLVLSMTKAWSDRGSR